MERTQKKDQTCPELQSNPGQSQAANTAIESFLPAGLLLCALALECLSQNLCFGEFRVLVSFAVKQRDSTNF